MFKDILIQLRLENKMTQTELANKIGVVKGTIANYESGLRKPDNDKLIALSEVFGVSVDYLLGLEETPTSISHYGGQDNDITFDDFTFAMYKETKDLTDEQKAALLDMAKTLKKMLKKQ